MKFSFYPGSLARSPSLEPTSNTFQYITLIFFNCLWCDSKSTSKCSTLLICANSLHCFELCCNHLVYTLGASGVATSGIQWFKIKLQIGIDVEEKERKIQNNITTFAKRCFSPQEAKFLEMISDPEIQRHEFIKLWTLKVNVIHWQFVFHLILLIFLFFLVSRTKLVF